MSQVPHEAPPEEPGRGPGSGAENPEHGGGESAQTHHKVDNGNVRDQYYAGTINNNNYFRGKQRRAVQELLQSLPKLSASLHPFSHPDHRKIAAALNEHRIVVLTSDREAAFVAGHALANDATFTGCTKLALFIATLQDKDRNDLDLVSVTEALVKESQRVLVVEVGEQRTFLETILHTPGGALTSIRVLLEQHCSYLVLVVDDALLEDTDGDERISAYHRWQVSHLQYLLSLHFPAEAGELEAHLRRIYAPPPATPADRRALYRVVESHLAHGPEAFKRFLAEREATASAAPGAAPVERRSIAAEEVFKEESELHKSAAFIAASFPEVNQKDFDRFVRLTLGDETAKTEEVRHAFRRDGKLVTVRDRKDERCTDVWEREADTIFRDCGLRTVQAGNGAWVVDFREPYVRGALRSHLHERHPWYLRRQCERLQQSGILFDAGLSSAAVAGLVRLFVERAIADPATFGRSWLSDLVRGPAAEKAVRQRVLERVAVLIREMAEHNVLRPVIRQFFEHLLGTAKHDTLLDLIAEPALRYVSDLDPLVWLRRLLNQGSDEIQERTGEQLLEVARRNGPRIYDFLASVRAWLPRHDKEPKRYSRSELLALNFPFIYCNEIAPWVTAGAWPSDHPLFYALPPEPAEARATIGELVEWLVDRRGAAHAEANPSDPLESAEAARFGHVGDLLEHFAWVLEAGPSYTAAPQAQALLTVILEEVDARLDPRERTWLQRAWQRTQEQLLKHAASHTADRTNLIARKAKLDQLRVRFATLGTARKIPIQGEPKP
jgi:hypothetical protein